MRKISLTSRGLFFTGLLLSVAMLQMAEALIYPETVQLIPSGNLQMSANWIDTPKNGTRYNVLLITSFVDTHSTHIKRDFTYEGTTAKIEIGDFNRHEWVPANVATIPSCNFPGFQQQPSVVGYRIFIQYLDATNATLSNKGCPTTTPCNAELSSFAYPMVPAYPPTGVAACGMQDYQNGGVRACDFIAPLPYSLRVYWNQIPDSERGYGNPPPTALYPIAYYRAEVSESQSFQSIIRNTTCTRGQTDNICNFDQRIAILTGLTRAQLYYFRVVGGTIIGDGNASSVSNANTSIWQFADPSTLQNTSNTSSTTPNSTTASPTIPAVYNDLTEFSSPGELDDPYSCKLQCKIGYFQFKGLESQACTPWTQLTCPSGDFQRNGNHERDNECVRCSTCQGRRVTANCTAYADMQCEDCGSLREHQRWDPYALDCKQVCENNYVMNMLSKECDFCHFRCAPGLEQGSPRVNCTHCVPCQGLRANAIWSEQDDRFDCMWECERGFELDFRDSPDLAQCVQEQIGFDELKLNSISMQACHPGQTLRYFKCVDCFDVMSNTKLPLKQFLGSTWEWKTDCSWQCLYQQGFTALKAEDGLYWECEPTTQMQLILEGADDTWIDPGRALLAISTEEQQAKPVVGDSERLLLALVVLAAVIVLILKCILVIHCFFVCRKK